MPIDDQTSRAIGAMWGRGDYARLARRLAPAADRLVDLCGPGVGSALDVAAGTGSVAVGLASSGWSVTATDISPALVEQGRAASERAGLDITWREASMDALPVADNAMDLVVSSFGLIFATEPEEAVAEIARALRPGGVVALTAWTPASYMAAMTAAMLPFLPSRSVAASPFAWGDPGVMEERLGRHFGEVEATRHTLPWAFDSPHQAMSFLFDHSPAHLAAHDAAGEQGPELRRTVLEHLSTYAEYSGNVAIDAEYLLVHARRAAPSGG